LRALLAPESDDALSQHKLVKNDCNNFIEIPILEMAKHECSLTEKTSALAKKQYYSCHIEL